MNSLDSSVEDEEHRFFDASECCVSPLSDDESNLLNSFGYGVWSRTPESVFQRREKFLSQMGFDSDLVLDKEAINRITENSGAVLRTPCYDIEFSSSRSSSCYDKDLSISQESSLDLSRAGNSGAGVTCNEDALEKKVQVMNLEQFETDCSGRVERKVNKIKRKLLSKLISIVAYKKGVPKDSRPSLFSSKSGRVKVHHFRKRLKELSALFLGQDIRAHKGSISTMKFSLDGLYLATGGVDAIVRLWKVVEDSRSIDIDTKIFDPSCVYFTVNSQSQLVPLFSEREKLGKSKRKTADSACVIYPPRVFRLVDKPVHEFRGHESEILDLSWSKNNCLLSASLDNTVRMWQVGCENCLKVFHHCNYVTRVQFNPVDDNRFVSGSVDGKVRIWAVNGCQVVGWTYTKDIVTAVCYRPNGQGLVVGTTRGTCHFYNIADDYFQLEAKVDLHRKKKAQCKRITGFQFFPQDQEKLMVTCACSRVKILHGTNVIGKYKGPWSSRTQLLPSFTPDGKHIMSASEDSNVYIWNCNDQLQLSRSHPKTKWPWERFSANASVAIPWSGFKPDNSDIRQICALDESSNNLVSLSSPAWFSLRKELVLETYAKGSATYPEEKLVCPFMRKSDYKFLKTCQSLVGPHAWNMVIVTAGQDGRIRSFHNYGLPVIL